MNLDLHVHSIFSGDSPVPPEDYARRMVELRAEYELDGFVLMEHNFWVRPEVCDLAALSAKYGLTILAGVEADTYWGHLLIYGVTDRLWNELAGNGKKKQEPVWLTKVAEEEGAVVVPAHPFRGMISLGDHIQELPHLCALEVINGGNLPEENLWASNLASKMGLSKVGGSDAHFLDELGLGATEFEVEVNTLEELVREIKAGRVRALCRDELQISSCPA